MCASNNRSDDSEENRERERERESKRIGIGKWKMGICFTERERESLESGGDFKFNSRGVQGGVVNCDEGK